MRRFFFATVIAVLAAAGLGFFLEPRGGGAADVPYRLATVDRGAIAATPRDRHAEPGDDRPRGLHSSPA